MLKLSARISKRNSISHCVAAVNINGDFRGTLRVEAELADELVGMLNGATELVEACQAIYKAKAPLERGTGLNRMGAVLDKLSGVSGASGGSNSPPKARKAPGAPSKPAKWGTWQEIILFFEGVEPFEVQRRFRTGAFLGAWAEWCEHRRQKKASLTAVAVKRIIIKLERMGHDRAIAAIEFSIGNGYIGIYEPKGQSNPASRPGRVQAKAGKYDKIDDHSG